MNLIASQYFPSMGENIESKPSFFEIVAHEQILTGLKKASRYVLSLIVQRNFSMYLFLKYYDEIFLLFQFLTEWHYLNNYDASFSEHLYNMKRVSTQKNPFFLQKTRFSTFFLILFPYIREKIQNKYIELKERDEESLFSEGNESRNQSRSEVQNTDDQNRTLRLSNISSLNSKIRYLFSLFLQLLNFPVHQIQKILFNYISKDEFKKLFMKYWPYMNGSIEAIFFIYLLGYLFDDWSYHSPIFHIQKLKLLRLNFQDIKIQKMNLIKKRVARITNLRNKPGLIFKIIEYAVRISYKVSDYFRSFLLLLVFQFKLFEWYYSSEHLRDSQKTIFIPENPPSPPKGVNNSNLPANNRLCPICKEERKNPTLVTKSGFVFCYKCIYNHLKEKKSCPISGLPATESDLRRLFE